MGSSRAPATAALRLMRQTTGMRPCSFFVDHIEIDTSNGGRQGAPVTYGPYEGSVLAPGSRTRPGKVSMRETGAGEAVDVLHWTLLAPVHAKVKFTSDVSDHVRVNGMPGKFIVRQIVSVAGIQPPIGLLVSMDEIA